jgi:hypothetical protein
VKLINFGAHARAKAAREEQRFDGPETDTSAETEGTGPLPFRDPSGFTHDRRDPGRARLLADCRERIALADRATLAGSQDLYCAAHGFLTNHSQELLHQFRIAFLSASDAGFRDLDESMTPAEEVRFGELSLVADEDFERDLTIDKLSARAVYACSQQLTALDRRIAALLPGRRLSSDQNPRPSLLPFSVPVGPKGLTTRSISPCSASSAFRSRRPCPGSMRRSTATSRREACCRTSRSIGSPPMRGPGRPPRLQRSVQSGVPLRLTPHRSLRQPWTEIGLG